MRLFELFLQHCDMILTFYSLTIFVALVSRERFLFWNGCIQKGVTEWMRCSALKKGYNRSTQNIIENVFSPSHPLLLPQICFYSRRSGYSPRLVGVGQTIIHWTTASAAAFWQKREHPRGDVGATTITPEKPGPGLTISSSISHLLPGIRIQL